MSLRSYLLVYNWLCENNFACARVPQTNRMWPISTESSSVSKKKKKKKKKRNSRWPCRQMATTTHYFLHCLDYLQPRQHCFSVLPYQLTLSLLLNGLQDVTTEINDKISKQAQLYIDATKRFQQETRNNIHCHTTVWLKYYLSKRP